jgi:hypothetical protein
MAQSTAHAPMAATGTVRDAIFARLRTQVETELRRFERTPPTPATAHGLETGLHAALDEAGRALVEHTFNGREPAARAQMAAKVRYQRQTYRLNKRTKAEVATSFGPITLWSWLYLCSEDGEPGLHPLHVELGIGAGQATPRLAERVARWAVDYSQQEVRRWLLAEHGLRWSNDRLRRVLRAFRRSAVAFRAEVQQARLVQWLTEAERSRGRHRPVLAVGRDGVMTPIRGYGYQEASAATVTVYDRRAKRRGTVYLGQMPQTHQVQLSEDLTALVTAVLAQGDGQGGRIKLPLPLQRP